MLLLDGMDIYFFTEKNQQIVFFCNSLEFYIISASEKKYIESIINGNSPESIIDKTRAHLLEEAIKNNIKSEPSQKDEIRSDSVKLTLNVSNICNMNCGYCYANGGCYNSTSGIMSEQVAKDAVDYFCKKFKYLDCIKFIGGEPFMNFNVIACVCEYVDELITRGIIQQHPVYSVITNGTICDEKIISIIKKYNVRIAISIDGPKCINDDGRKMVNGSGSYNKIIENIKKIQKATNGKQPVALNAVYSNIHEKYGVSVNDTLESLKIETAISDIHIVPVDAKDKTEYRIKDIDNFIKGITDTLKTNDEDEYFWLLKCMTKSLKTKRTTGTRICNAGVNTFSVSIDGSIYPCHLFTDDMCYRFGSIYDNNLYESQTYKDFLDKFITYNRVNSGECKNCFAKNVCIGCAGANVFRTGNLLQCDKFICDVNRSVLREAILNILFEGENGFER